MREDPLLHPDHEHGAELEALRVVERHQRDEALLLADRVLVGEERDLLEERRTGSAPPSLDVLLRDADELLQVLDAAARLDRPLGLERLEVAGLLEDALDELGDGQLLRLRLRATGAACCSAVTALSDAPPTPARLGVAERLPQRRRRSRPPRAAAA